MSQSGLSAVTRRTGQISTRNFVELCAQGREQKCKSGWRACRAVQEPLGEAQEFGTGGERPSPIRGTPLVRIRSPGGGLQFRFLSGTTTLRISEKALGFFFFLIFQRNSNLKHKRSLSLAILTLHWLFKKSRGRNCPLWAHLKCSALICR